MVGIQFRLYTLYSPSSHHISVMHSSFLQEHLSIDQNTNTILFCIILLCFTSIYYTVLCSLTCAIYSLLVQLSSRGGICVCWLYFFHSGCIKNFKYDQRHGDQIYEGDSICFLLTLAFPPARILPFYRSSVCLCPFGVTEF